MRIILTTLVLVLGLTGCTKNPSDLACEVWNSKRQKASVPVDYWAELSASRKLSLEEEKQAWLDQNAYIAVLREMDSVGCDY